MLYNVTFSGWWLVLPGAVLVGVFLFALRPQRRRKSLLCMSIVLALTTLIAMVFTSGKKLEGSLTYVDATNLDRRKYWAVGLVLENRGISVEVTGGENGPEPNFVFGSLFSEVIFSHSEDYPYPSQRESLIENEFVVTTVGFQIGKWNGVVGGSYYWWYSITFPQWFLLIGSLLFPIILIRKFRRRRYHERNSLCMDCGFDLRAHNPGDKCPECGRLIPARAATQPSIVPAQTPPAPPSSTGK
jgi:hypothetical protein